MTSNDNDNGNTNGNENNNKQILITGATGALGFSSASYLYEQGYNIIVVGRNMEKLQDMYKNFTASQCTIIQNPLVSEEAIKGLFKTIKEKIGKLDALVNCAGAINEKPINIVKEQDIMDIFHINTFSPILLTKYFSKKSNHNANASIIFISSLASYNGSKGLSIYASTKGALDGMIMSLSAEFNGDIRVNSIVPGMMDDGMGSNFIKNISNETHEKFQKDYILGLGKAQDVAHMIEYLISEKSRWITGQKFFLDGGYLSR